MLNQMTCHVTPRKRIFGVHGIMQMTVKKETNDSTRFNFNVIHVEFRGGEKDLLLLILESK